MGGLSPAPARFAEARLRWRRSCRSEGKPTRGARLGNDGARSRRRSHWGETTNESGNLVGCGLPVVLYRQAALRDGARGFRASGCRSEEHTSELQSPVHLVCRLLLEKKNSESTRWSSCC